MVEKNAQIIKFIIERLPGALGRTHLIKLIYLADYHSRRLFGKPISTFNYAWWEQGPFDQKFYDCLDGLKEKYIKEEMVYFFFYQGYVYHDVPTDVKYTFSESERYILEYVINKYGKARLQTLLEDVVYKTEPMLEATKKKAFKKKLNMKIVDNVDKSLYAGIDPSDIIEAERALQDGTASARSVEDMFNAIQS